MRKIFIVLLCCTTVLLAGYVGLRVYSSWKQSHLLSVARQFADRADVRNALLAAQQVIRSNPRNVEACRFMADMAETNFSPDVVFWRSRVLELAPDSAEDRLAMVRAAISQGDFITATNCLGGMRDTATNTAKYQLIAGLTDVATHQISEAEAHFIQASHLEPTNLVPQLNLAVLRLNDTNASLQNEARASLEKLSADPTLRSQALRELIADAFRHNQTNDALYLSDRLVQTSNAPISDQLIYLSVLHALHKEELSSAIAACQKSAADDPAKIYQLATWQVAAQGTQETLFWLESLPSQIQSNRTVQLVESECHVDQHDWRELQLTLPKENWAELEFLRHAFLTRAFRGLDLKSSADTEWSLAVSATENRKDSLMMLLRLTGAWQWQGEKEELLWIFFNRFPDEKWAYTALEMTFFATGRTRSLMSLYGQESKRSPSDLEARNNLAMTALLLDAVEIKPQELARELYEQHGTNATFASTYALSLHFQKKDSEALRVMGQLKPDDFKQGAISAYYGLILESAGSNVLAQTYLDVTPKTPLLPEERTLFAQAKAHLAGEMKN